MARMNGMRAPRKAKRLLALGVLLLAFTLFELPSFARFAYGFGWTLVEPSVNGVNVEVGNGWYPLATNDSLLGRAFLPANAPALVYFNRPSLVLPWKSDGFSAIAYATEIPNNSIESEIRKPWGRILLIKGNPTSVPTRRLYVMPELKIGFILDDVAVLDDIVSVSGVDRPRTN